MNLLEKEKIRRLIEKFMDGRTSTDEEQWLAEYFRTEEVPQEWTDYGEMFAFFDRGMVGTPGMPPHEATGAYGQATIAGLHAGMQGELLASPHNLGAAADGAHATLERSPRVRRWGSLSHTLRHAAAACIAIVALAAGYLLYHGLQTAAPLASTGRVVVQQRVVESATPLATKRSKEAAASWVNMQQTAAEARYGARPSSHRKAGARVRRAAAIVPRPSAKAAEMAEQRQLAEIAEAARKLDQRARELAEEYRQTVRARLEAKGYKAVYDENGSIIYTSSSTKKIVEL